MFGNVNSAENTTISNKIQENTTNTTQEPITETVPATDEKEQTAETEIASFSTKIYTKESGRQKNISLTCSSLDNTTVESGATFSFCNTVGKATTAKGYEKADVFRNGEVIKALGGGNCQVSTTLYNAVLKVSDFKVVERHEHSNSVPYIKNGKDAAVSYGTYDFKFRNNLPNKIKIQASTDKKYVYIKILKLE